MPLFALFVIYDEHGDLYTISREVEDTTPETLRAVLADEDFRTKDVFDLFVIEGTLSNPGREYLGDDEDYEGEEG